jgi:hypothetical protein
MAESIQDEEENLLQSGSKIKKRKYGDREIKGFHLEP